MKASDIKKVLIIGAGTMGRQIGLQNALFGRDVTFYDLNKDIFKVARTHIGKIAAGYVRGGYISEEMAASALARISFTADIKEACADVNLVSESVPENVELKQRVWGEFSKHLPVDAILTTNTSTLVPSMFADATGHPERFLAWHFAFPVFIANIADVMPHAGTDQAVTDVMLDYSREVGLVPLYIKKEWPRYVYNEMFVAFLEAAQRLVVNEVARIEDIDRAWMGIMGAPFGPFGIMDNVGLDTCLSVIKEHVNSDPSLPWGQEIIDFFQAKVDAGELGRKSGQGFYTYPKPAYQQPCFLDRVVPKYKKQADRS